MANFESVLAGIPGYGGYLAKETYNRNQTLGDIQQMSGIQGMLASMQQQQIRQAALAKENELRGKLASLTPEQRANPAFMRDLEIQYASPKDALAALSKNPMENASPTGKLIFERDQALKKGDTKTAELYTQMLNKSTQTEGSQTQEWMNHLLGVQQKARNGQPISPEEMSKAQMIYAHLTQPRVLPDGSQVQPNYPDQFNPSKNFGLGALTPPPATGVLSAPSPQAPAPARSGALPSQPVTAQNSPIVPPRGGDALRILQEELATALPQDRPALEREIARVSGGVAPANNSGNSTVVVTGKKKYVREMPDGNGGLVGITADGKTEKIPLPDGVRLDLKPGQVWNQESQRVEWRPNSPEFAKQSNAHAGDLDTVSAAKDMEAQVTTKINNILDPTKKGAFENLFGGYNAKFVTQYMPGDETQSMKKSIESLKDNMKTLGKNLLVNAGGTGIGQITEREWPILERQIDAIDPMMGEAEARAAFKNVKDAFTQMTKRLESRYDTEWGDSQFYKKSGKPKPPSPSAPPKSKSDVFNKADAILKGE